YLSRALNRLQFLGEGMKYIITRRRQTINSMAKLRRQLRGFLAVRKIEGLKIKQKANSKMFQYRKDNGSKNIFKMIISKQHNLPPILTAPGLNPQPVLIWTRNKRGKLEHNIEFR